MRESRVKITLTIQLILTIDPTEQYPPAMVGEVLAKQNVTSILIENLCDIKGVHGDRTELFQFSATCTRSVVTTTGEHTFALDYIEDTAASEDDQSHFRHIEKLMQFDGKKHYQEGISAKTADLTTTLSYRDAASAGESFNKTLSPDIT